MSVKFLVGFVAGMLTVGSFAHGSIIVKYDFAIANGASTTETLTQYKTPTTSAPNVTTQNFTVGTNTGTATNNNVSGFYSSPGPNYLSVNNSLTTTNDDTNFYIDFVVTANSGFTMTPTSFAIVGAKGGASNVRSFLLFDDHDGLPTSITPTASSPTVTGGTQVGGGTFSTVRQTGPAAMDSFTLNFPASDQNLSTFDVRVFFDTQANGQTKNIDLSSLTLNGDVVATPEPSSVVAALAFAIGTLGCRRRR